MDQTFRKVIFLIASVLASGVNCYGFTAKDGTQVIVGSSGVGALLGLSTLSFSTRPQTKFTNIAYGAALGIIAGVGVTVFLAATDQGVYDKIDPIEMEEEEEEDKGAELFLKGKQPENIVYTNILELRFF